MLLADECQSKICKIHLLCAEKETSQLLLENRDVRVW